MLQPLIDTASDLTSCGSPWLTSLIPSGLAIPLKRTRRYAADEQGLLKHWYKDVVTNVCLILN